MLDTEPLLWISKSLGKDVGPLELRFDVLQLVYRLFCIAHFIFRVKQIMQPPDANPVSPLQVPHGRVATCFDDLDGSLVILVQLKVHGTTADFVKNIHGRKTNGAQGEVSCCELRLWRAVTNN